MATSLARQLRRLAAPQTNLLKADRKKASILFDPTNLLCLLHRSFWVWGTWEARRPLLRIMCNTIYRLFEDFWASRPYRRDQPTGWQSTVQVPHPHLALIHHATQRPGWPVSYPFMTWKPLLGQSRCLRLKTSSTAGTGSKPCRSQVCP